MSIARSIFRVHDFKLRAFVVVVLSRLFVQLFT